MLVYIYCQQFVELLNTYLLPTFSFNLRTFLFALPRKKLYMVWDITEDYLERYRIPSRIAMLIRDIIAFRNRVHINQPYEVKKEKNRGYMKILFHNKGIEPSSNTT